MGLACMILGIFWGGEAWDWGSALAPVHACRWASAEFLRATVPMYTVVVLTVFLHVVQSHIRIRKHNFLRVVRSVLVNVYTTGNGMIAGEIF